MKDKKNILLLCGGGGTEHEISLISAKYILQNLEKLNYNTYFVEIEKDGTRRLATGEVCELRKSGELFIHDSSKTIEINFVIPCIHGPPGENGEIQSVFELMNVPYFGAGPEASILSFNKVSTKLWMDALKIPNTPYKFVSKRQNRDEVLKIAKDALNEWGCIFIKASSQGSSVGCYKVDKENELQEKIDLAFKYSPYLLFEKEVKGRELEIAVFEYEDNLITTVPGEIYCPSGFYTYEEKYNSESKTTTNIVAPDISQSDVEKMQTCAKELFTALNVKHLARVDFFYTKDGEVYLNEINTFPGMTEISMFPKMMINAGYKFEDYLEQIISKNIK